MKPSIVDVSRVRHAVQTLVEYVLSEYYEAFYIHSGVLGAAATLRVVMRRHDVRNGIMPPKYETQSADVLLRQFYEHPVAEEYGFGKEGIDRGAEGGS